MSSHLKIELDIYKISATYPEKWCVRKTELWKQITIKAWQLELFDTVEEAHNYVNALLEANPEWTVVSYT